jgi:hypothetical protein
MINKTDDAERWNEAMRIALAKEMRTMNFRLYRELICINFTKLCLKTLIISRRVIRKLFLYGKLLKCKGMLLLIEILLFMNELYDKFSRHKHTPVVNEAEPPNVKSASKLKPNQELDHIGRTVSRQS